MRRLVVQRWGGAARRWNGTAALVPGVVPARAWYEPETLLPGARRFRDSEMKALEAFAKVASSNDQPSVKPLRFDITLDARSFWR